MTLTINLPPDVLERLTERAAAEGSDAAAVAGRTLAREFGPPEPPKAQPAEDDWDMPYTREEAAANAAAMREMFAQWAKEDDAEDLDEARREWEDVKQSMNETRRLEGRPPAFGEDD